MSNVSALPVVKLPVPGDTYELPRDDSPWPRRNPFRYRVLEVKDGWVRYAQISDHSGEPMLEFATASTIAYFTSMFTKVER